MENTRVIVLELLLEIERTDCFGSNILKQVLEKFDYMSVQDKAFMKRLAEGTIERKLELDYIINQFSKVPVRKMKPLIRCLMRMTTYQIVYMDGIPDGAACNEALKIAEMRRFHNLKGFINGVLRNIARNKEQIQWPDKLTDWKEYVSIKNSMPMVILNIWEKDYGKERAISLAEYFTQIMPVSVRIDERQSEEEIRQLTGCWDKQGISFKQNPYISYAYTIEKISGLKDLPGFQEGKVTVQDVSSMFVAECAGIQKGQTVLDVCAAPGGKTMHVASKLDGEGVVEARDVSPRKVELIQENLQRLGFTNVNTTVWDATKADGRWVQKADVLLLDVPCSGLGVLGKKRDIKYHVTEEGMKELTLLQKEIVKSSIDYVKPGGVVMYSTCTLHKQENQEMARWISDCFDVTLESIDEYIPKSLRNEETASGMLQFFPDEHHCDGFFLAKFRRKG